MKIFVLFFGEYEQRGIHSVHTSREIAEGVCRRVQRDWRPQDKSDPDIEEHELDPDLCAECGYEADLHTDHPRTRGEHSFLSALGKSK
jgi:hypothetical protein